MQVGEFAFVSDSMFVEYKRIVGELSIKDLQNSFKYAGEIIVDSKRFGILRFLPEIENLKFSAFGHKFSAGEYLDRNSTIWNGYSWSKTWDANSCSAFGVYLFFVPWDEVWCGFLHKG